MERAAITIQRRERFGRIGRATPSKAAALVQTARDQSAASGICLTDNTEILEPLPTNHNPDGGSEDGSQGLTDAAVPELQSLPMPYKERLKPKQPPAPTNPDDINPNKDNDNNKHGKMQAPGAPIEHTGAAGGPSDETITNTDGGKSPPNPDDPLDPTSLRQVQDELARNSRNAPSRTIL
jgi:hypothetical protein